MTLVTDQFDVTLPMPAGQLHPDLIAVAAWMATAPWIQRPLVLERGVSAQLAATFAARGIEVTPVDDTLAPRAASAGVPGLSYSAGADSIAASEVLPRDIPYIYFRRVAHPRVPNRHPGRLGDQKVERAARAAVGRGRDVQIVRTNLEYLRLPTPGYPTWSAVAIGLVLLADACNLGAATFGAVLGSKYLTSGYRYRSGKNAGEAAEIFAAVGLPFLRPTAGMTEVATLSLAAESDLADINHSCLHGRDGPCLSCVKCFRKELVMAAVEDRAPSAALWEKIGPDHPVLRNYAKGPPWHMQHVLEYALTHARGIEDTPAAWMQRFVPVPAEETTWVTRYYPKALERDVPEPFREHVRQAVVNRMPMMDEADIHTVETWDAHARSAAGAV